MSDTGLTRDQILSADDLPRERVAVPEWGGAVWLRGLTGSERDAFEAELYKVRGTDIEVNRENVRARLAVLCVVDEHGNRLFSADDVAAVGKKSAGALERVFDVAQRLSGLRAQDVEALAGNSGRGPGAASSSPSPNASA